MKKIFRLHFVKTECYYADVEAIDIQHAYDSGLTAGYTGRKDRGNNKFGKEWLDLNNKGVSLREIGRMYGVAHHTVKHTIIKYAEEQEV